VVETAKFNGVSLVQFLRKIEDLCLTQTLREVLKDEPNEFDDLLDELIGKDPINVEK